MSLIPEQVHLSLADDPTSMKVQFVTLHDVLSAPSVLYSFDDGILNRVEPATVKKFVYDNVVRYIYTAELKNLPPKTNVRYKVGSVEEWYPQAQSFNFTTFPEGNDFPYRMCIMGDLGVFKGDSLPYLIQDAQQGLYDILVHVGDIAYDLHTNSGYVGDEFMRGLEPAVAHVPYIVIAGNHEDDKFNFSNYRYRFDMPNDPFGDNQFYSFDLGPVHFIGISTEFYGFFYEYGQESVFTQYNWLIDDLKKANANRENVPFIVSWQHRPFYCSNSNSFECSSFENSLIRKGFQDMPGLEDVFIEYGMDIAFWGHEHSYERFYPIFNRTAYKSSDVSDDPYDNPVAPTYIITGSAGCHSTPAAFAEVPVNHSAFRSEDFGYTIMTVLNKTHLLLEQISIEQQKRHVIDSIWIKKTKGIHPSHVRSKRHAGHPFPHPEEQWQSSPCHSQFVEFVFLLWERALRETGGLDMIQTGVISTSWGYNTYPISPFMSPESGRATAVPHHLPPSLSRNSVFKLPIGRQIECRFPDKLNLAELSKEFFDEPNGRRHPLPLIWSPRGESAPPTPRPDFAQCHKRDKRAKPVGFGHPGVRDGRLSIRVSLKI
ncbi:unnamed protein product [Bursaphelenchus xylophilus]|uniref:Purple acid phosphatase n=1 Tax=Bursaphelenchus xylophilus TaxID=6326 RepID=A0A811LUB4_BURXY|nr:unnamed protein product [Bursaphelenchus xylophilus]CAG9123898.1 unnamed protein product [Bursaphelenchus xylophilus]